VRTRPARAPKRSASSTAAAVKIPLLFCKNFAQSLAAVTGFAQTLVVRGIYEQLPIAFERLEVVHLGGSHSDPALSALSAERLAEQLGWPQIVLPDRQEIPCMPRLALGTALPLWLMLRAPAVLSQLSASGMLARSQWT